MGDCIDEYDFRCLASKQYGPSVVIWRGLAVELFAIVVYLLIRRR